MDSGDRVIHPDWCGAKRAGVVVRVVNEYYADIRFDGWERDVRAALFSLRPEPQPEIPDEQGEAQDAGEGGEDLPAMASDGSDSQELWAT